MTGFPPVLVAANTHSTLICPVLLLCTFDRRITGSSCPARAYTVLLATLGGSGGAGYAVMMDTNLLSQLCGVIHDSPSSFCDSE